MGRNPTLKHTIAVLSCAAALVASLTACSGSGDKSTLPTFTGSSGPSATTSPPTTIAPAPTSSGPVALIEHATYNYDGLKVTVNLPTNIPEGARSSMLVSSEFFQGVGRTFARNELDPSVRNLSSPEIAKYIQTVVVPGAVQGIGSLDVTISKVRTAAGRFTSATVCVDQSKVVQVRKYGSHFVDPNAKKYPTFKMTAELNRGMAGTKLTRLISVAGTC